MTDEASIASISSATVPVDPVIMKTTEQTDPATEIKEKATNGKAEPNGTNDHTDGNKE